MEESRGGIVRRPRKAEVRFPPGFIEPSFGQRLLGALLDGVIVAMSLGVLVRAAGSSTTVGAVAMAAVAAYEISLTATRGQTLGKLVMGTKVIDRSTGALPTSPQATARWLTVIAASVVSLVVPALEPLTAGYGVVVFAPVLWRPLHRGLHDRAAGTVVTSVS